MNPASEPLPRRSGALAWWERVWLTPADPTPLHVVRCATGVLLLVWLLAHLGHVWALFGVGGVADLRLYQFARSAADVPPVQAWSPVYVLGTSPTGIAVQYWLGVAAAAGLAVGVATRVTSMLGWLTAITFTSNPAFYYGADSLLVMLTFYLMVGYACAGLTGQAPLRERLLGRDDHMLWRWTTQLRRGGRPPRSLAANVACLLLRTHLCLVLVFSALHKLQSPAWWSGTALWFPLHEPFSTSLPELVRSGGDVGRQLLWLSLAAYAVLAWQLSFPLWSGRHGLRYFPAVGALAGWWGCCWIYDMPLYGAAVFVASLAFLPMSKTRCDVQSP